jgi:hypothetical protein
MHELRSHLVQGQPPVHAGGLRGAAPRREFIRPRSWRAVLVVLVLAILASAGVGIWRAATPAQASCPRYTIRWGDTLWLIALHFHTTTANLVQINHIANPNLIIAGQTICVAANTTSASHVTHGGSDPLEWSNPGEVRAMLINAADRHRLPRNLVLAIAWRESTWTQHVISWDGGVGTMQLMWYTTAWLNGYLGSHYNPDRLYDNIELGVSYLAILWNDFHGNLDDLISAYNEGERAVRTYGIFNWWYVNSVLWLMRYFG